KIRPVARENCWALAPICRIFSAFSPHQGASMRSIVAIFCGLFLPITAAAQALPGTKLLEGKQDFAKVMVEGIDRYLTKATEQAAKDRAKYWQPDFSSVKAFDQSVEPNRARFRRMIGVIDERVPVTMTKIATVEQGSLVAET